LLLDLFLRRFRKKVGLMGYTRTAKQAKLAYAKTGEIIDDLSKRDLVPRGRSYGPSTCGGLNCGGGRSHQGRPTGSMHITGQVSRYYIFCRRISPKSRPFAWPRHFTLAPAPPHSTPKKECPSSEIYSTGNLEGKQLLKLTDLIGVAIYVILNAGIYVIIGVVIYVI
jgi:hypothetical protein